MFNHLKRLGGDSLLYALMNVGTKLIAFLMLPIYTTYLSPSEMGVFENVDALISILIFVVIFGTDNALAYYFYNTNDEKERTELFQTALYFRVIIAVGFNLIFIFFGEYISTILLGTPDYKYIFFLAGTVLIVETIITLVLTYYRFQFKSKKVVFTTVAKLAFVAILSYLFLKYSDLQVSSIYLGRLISVIIIVLVLVPSLIKMFSFKFNKEILKKLVVYGAPLVPASVAFWIITFSNRFFLTTFESLNSVGIYGVAIKFATVISLLTSSVQMAWRPYSMSIKDNSNAKQIYSTLFLLILIIGMTGLLGIATVIPLVMEFMIKDPAYAEASRYIAILSLGSFLSFYYLIISIGLFFNKKTGVISIYVGISAVISVVLNILLIPVFSIWGAVIALIASYLFVNISIFIRSQKEYYIPVSIFKMVLLFLSGILGILTIVYVQENEGISNYYIVIPWIVNIVVTLLTIKDKLISIRK
ncbi:lipopolysaccharide biosynthesis protein [Sutcliffiella horikoshii]|uniref:lipopolysaccharide biosynthesis protein n=1 Tax=Sutcliffiella horikoshii TaxID=79883 RepID=UPI001EEEA456|nr:oligosaccharide flippase family protein [Sutcliffiella horikoshii]